MQGFRVSPMNGNSLMSGSSPNAGYETTHGRWEPLRSVPSTTVRSSVDDTPAAKGFM